ncbi:HIT domain-containing protein [Nonomuraea typhae]|uniref:HIT domain-containing protein n=1 Tax=Nonomuraea typhae TaxID=2603600 RepID=UPI003CCDBAD0
MATCAFCGIAAGQAPAVIVRDWPDALAIRPRSGGVNDGHVLILPRTHVADAGTDPEVTAAVMHRAAEMMAGYDDANLITSKGAAATQTVGHLHVHIVPAPTGMACRCPGLPSSRPPPARPLSRPRWPSRTGPSPPRSRPTSGRCVPASPSRTARPCSWPAPPPTWPTRCRPGGPRRSANWPSSGRAVSR